MKPVQDQVVGEFYKECQIQRSSVEVSRCQGIVQWILCFQT